MKKIYITTPIYYPSGKPHIGHAYSTIIADVIGKYKKLIGYDVYFTTGTDEHGQKIAEKALAENKTCQQLVDEYSNVFKELFKKLNISYTMFIRTSQDFHIKAVQKTFSDLLKKDFIYLGEWEGLYCVSCEENYTKTQVIKKNEQLCCQHGHLLTTKKESSYFLKIKQFKQWILEFLNQKDIIYPENRVNELINSFVENEAFDDLSISRTSFSWGVPILENNKHVIYVWLDALLNYLTALGYQQENNKKFTYFWNDEKTEIIHIMSKEITRFHCIYWPIILKMLNLRMPSKFICHGWITTNTGKMSKSLGNVIDPNELINKYGVDAVRYFFSKEISLKDDFVFSEELFINSFNNDLANNFGNLINRLIGMHKKYTNGVVPNFTNPTNEYCIVFYDKVKKIDDLMIKKIDELFPNEIIKEILNLIFECNQLIENSKPWNLFKEQKTEELNQILSLLVIATKKIIYYLSPVISDATNKALNQLNIDVKNFNFNFIKNDKATDGLILNNAEPIFLRIENKK